VPEAVASASDLKDSGWASRTIVLLWTGALLVMLTDSMIPEARERARDAAGLATVLGFAVAAGLSQLSP